MLQAVRRAAAALQAQCVPRVVSQSSHHPIAATQLYCNNHADTLTTSAVVGDRPTSAVLYTEDQIADIRQRVFGTHIGDGLPSGRKLLRKKLIGEKVAAYYDLGEPVKDPAIVDLDAERYIARSTQSSEIAVGYLFMFA